MAQEVVRPFTPNTALDLESRKVLALEHIAVALSAIDHNLDRNTRLLDGFYKLWAEKNARR